MKIIITKDYEQMSRVSADLVAQQIKNKPDTVLGLPTGSTPIGLYKHLRQKFYHGLDFSKVVTFNLDEYWSIDPKHPQSYKYFMNKHLLSHVNIPSKNTHIPDGKAENPLAECHKYDQALAASDGIDLMIVGVGVNGHIGFNEPSDSLEYGTNVVELSEKTRAVNSKKFFDGNIEKVPTKAISMGIASIMKSKKVLLMANGKSKHHAVSTAMTQGITTRNPMSIICTHPRLIIILDSEAWGQGVHHLPPGTRVKRTWTENP